MLSGPTNTQVNGLPVAYPKLNSPHGMMLHLSLRQTPHLVLGFECQEVNLVSSN